MIGKKISEALEAMWPNLYMEGYHDEEAIATINSIIRDHLRQESLVLEMCCEDVIQRTKSDDPTRFSVYSHPQTWPNTSCGFGGIAGQAITNKQTVVIRDEDTREWFVYHAGRFAYRVAGNNYCLDIMLDHIGSQNVPGKTHATRTFGAENVNLAP